MLYIDIDICRTGEEGNTIITSKNTNFSDSSFELEG